MLMGGRLHEGEENERMIEKRPLNNGVLFLLLTIAGDRSFDLAAFLFFACFSLDTSASVGAAKYFKLISIAVSIDPHHWIRPSEFVIGLAWTSFPDEFQTRRVVQHQSLYCCRGRLKTDS
mmetsp:Transcript_26067/g.48622  ORF Transcript_26067/g.48622 Transcript_26067/m.48622 type:complete len:120 (+) Transcript_26067:332-691(+)